MTRAISRTIASTVGLLSAITLCFSMGFFGAAQASTDSEGLATIEDGSGEAESGLAYDGLPVDDTTVRGEQAGVARHRGDGPRAEGGDLGGSTEWATPRARPRPDLRKETFHLPAARAVRAENDGDEALRRVLDAGSVRPGALASGDFDEDGVQDLVCGYASPEGDILALHRGNVDAIFPHSPEARQRRAEGRLGDEPFLSPARLLEAPLRPDFLATGDFDNDGHWDVVVAAEGVDRLYLLAGDGHGGLGPAEPVDLPGAVTAVAAGEINRAEGLVDLVVGVRGPEGSAVLVFEGPDGALRSTAEVLPLTEAPTALLLARLGDSPWHDLAAAAGDALLIVRGRDRRLLLDEARRAEVGPPVVERIDMPSPIEAMAWGDFAWEPTPARELALLLEDGTIRLLSREARVDREWPRADTGDDRTPGASTGQWRTIGQRELFERGSSGADLPPARVELLPARISGLPTEDLAIVDAFGLQVLAGMVLEEPAASRDPADTVARLADPGVLASVELEAVPVVALPMRLNPDALTDLVLLKPGAGAPAVVETAPQATITVNTAVDDSTAGNGLCSLREAINNANGDSDTTGGDCAAGAGTDAIHFNIAGGGSTAVVTLSLALPAISDSVTINGTAQGCASPPCVVLDGVSAGALARGLDLAAGSSTIRGLVVHRFGGDGVFATSSGNRLEGNFIGTDLTGTADRGNNGSGVRLEAGASSNTVGGTIASARNVISGNAGDGVFVYANSNDNLVLGNYVGTDLTGTVDLGNDFAGVEIQQASGNTIGGTTPGSGNVLSGNELNGFLCDPGCDGNLVLGNRIGTDITGTLDVGNFSVGVRITNGSDNTIGGTAEGARNIISGNESDGVFILGDMAQRNQVVGNFIGTDVTGTVDLGNNLVGVEIQDGSDNTVGGVSDEARNIISGNDSIGVLLDDVGATQNSVLGNFIGTDVTGTVDLGNSSVGVWIVGPNNMIGGLSDGARNIISGNDSDGVFIVGAAAQGNQVLGNFIGTDVTGTVELLNLLVGVEIQAASNNTIGGESEAARNVISGNNSDGVFIVGQTAQGNQVLGNFIGTDVTGTVELGNALAGVEIQDASNNTVGGESEGARNVISGNALMGVLFDNKTTTQNSVLGNFIGTDVTGTVDLGNGSVGVWIVGPENTIGGTSEGARNVISGNDLGGVRIIGDFAQANQVLGNFIGADVTGTADLGNTLAGVEIQGASNNTIGGTTSGARNIISGNDADGVFIFGAGAQGNQIAGNFIGTQVDGTSPLGNALHGIRTLDNAGNNIIGGTGVTPGTCDGPCNRIAFSEGSIFDGVRIQAGSGAGNAILGNAIFSNANLGIDLGDSGVTPNDAGDGDSGANDLQNFPVLSLAEATPSGVTVEGSLDSTPDEDFRVEFFASPACDASGNGEGTRFLGFTDVVTDPSGIANFSAVLSVSLPEGESIAATATNASDSTSEFSGCADVTCVELAVFGQTILAPDKNSLSWVVTEDVRFVKGDLADVGSYVVAASGDLLGASALDISADDPQVGDGLYYLVRSLNCGSWQNAAGSEPQRDEALP